MNPDRAVLIASPGAGLGHLVRAGAVALRLLERGISAHIVTNSPFASGFARLTGLPVDGIPKKQWRRALPDYTSRVRPRLIILDVFPWGLEGEWPKSAPARTPFVLLARRLRVERYLEAIGMDWDRGSPTLERVALLEPLEDEQLTLLEGGQVFKPPGRVRLPLSMSPTAAPAELEALLDAGRLRLIVHSGPPEEVDRLLESARRDAAADHGEVALISPWPDLEAPCPVFEYFPAARLFERAAKIIGGAGYNLMAETDAFPEKRLLLAFDRKFDDQAGRLGGAKSGETDGGPALADWLAAQL